MANQSVFPEPKLPSFGASKEELPGRIEVNLEDMIAYPTWKEMLFELVYSESLDPWNIDISRLCEAYLAKIKNLKRVELHIPANVILAASILLRMKSDMFHIEEEAPISEAEVGEDFSSFEIPSLALSGRIPPKRMVTLEELTSALETVFAKQKQKEEKTAQKMGEMLPDFKLNVSEFDIDKEMEKLYERALKCADSENLALFSRIIEECKSESIIFSFLALLHLAQGGKLHVFQEKFFGEIFVRIPQEMKSAIKVTAHGS
ncbi:hypothetical protein COV61_05135 [Candidatus Micrarchaeota archaeon CG11_big_fil_rev_8_21_14_0_20_47_5]|nr:MAG: hypothetical protein COV61_05135 [Candidatus Micrarchaeota archaeon CG11_big_fil_rev_8_21_14_0_20_47_5]